MEIDYNKLLHTPLSEWVHKEKLNENQRISLFSLAKDIENNFKRLNSVKE